MARTVARAASGIVTQRLAPAEDPAAWLMREEEADAVAEPAARLLARHAPLPAGGTASDMADGVELIVALVAWIFTSLERSALARRAAPAPAEEADQPGAPGQVFTYGADGQLVNPFTGPVPDQG